MKHFGLVFLNCIELVIASIEIGDQPLHGFGKIPDVDLFDAGHATAPSLVLVYGKGYDRAPCRYRLLFPTEVDWYSGGIMIRPKLFIDTNICNYAANGTIRADEWNRVRKHIGAHYRYCISFVTLKELLGRLARGGDEFFERNKTPLHILYGPGNRCFLPYPSCFAIRTVLGYPVSRKSDIHSLTDEEFGKTVTRAVLNAPSKAQLKDGIPSFNQKRRMLTFDLDHFDKHEDEAQKEHANLLQGMRDGVIDRPEPMTWAAWILHQHELTPYEEDCKKLVACLDAAYQYSVALSNFANNKNYNFQKPGNITAWGDTFQLFYLCEERMYFLTADNDFRDYANGSTQANRIILYKDFVRSLIS